MGIWVKRGLAILIAGGIVFLVATRVFEAREDAARAKSRQQAWGGGRVVNVDLAQAWTGVVSDVLLLTGALKPKEQVDVTSKATGRVESIRFRVGDRIGAGDLVAELEDDELRQQVHRAEAVIAVARASYRQRRAEHDNARAELERAESLSQDGLISSQDYEAQKTSLAVVNAQVELAEAQQKQAEAELSELKIRLAQTKIYSPMRGIAATRYVDVGALVSPTTPIIRIVNLSTMVTQGNVPERHIGRLRVGNPTTVRVDALPEQPFTGRVARISPVLDAATRSALIEIDIPNANGDLRAEMFARIELDLGATREATLIPRDSLVYRGQQAGVYVVEGSRPVFRSIETGMTRQETVEVLSNLDPGTAIVGRGASMIRDGDRIAAPETQEEAGGRPGAGGAESAGRRDRAGRPSDQGRSARGQQGASSKTQ